MRKIHEGAQRPSMQGEYISVKSRARPCYNTYVTFLRALFVITNVASKVLYYVVRRYHISFMSVSEVACRKGEMAENASAESLHRC